MIETEPAVSPLRPLQRHAQIEVDTFCGECGYNLHAQPVTRDERLGIFICRCPECGRFHAAGKSTSAETPWLSRLAVGALLFWVLVILNAVVWLSIGLGAVMVVHVEEFSYRSYVADDGREVVFDRSPGGGSQLVYKGTTQPVASARNIRTIEPRENLTPQQQEWRRQQNLIGGVVLALSDVALGLAGGMLLVTFIWHWPRRRYAWAMLLPFIVAAFVLTGLLLLDDDFANIPGWVVSRVLMHAALQAMFLFIGIRIGRPLARGLLRTFIPPAPRQHFAFLWRADGKPMPPASAPGTG